MAFPQSPATSRAFNPLRSAAAVVVAKSTEASLTTAAASSHALSNCERVARLGAADVACRLGPIQSS
jgi:hypothetical protein